LYEFFKNLNGAPDHDDVELSVLSESLQENIDFDNLNIHLNDSITRDEILTCIKKLKNDKASGDDMIRNEFIKSTPDMFFPKQLKMVIGRKFLGSVFAPLFL
jgi:hypothetical protein